jgi:hypothetical protein
VAAVVVAIATAEAEAEAAGAAEAAAGTRLLERRSEGRSDAAFALFDLQAAFVSSPVGPRKAEAPSIAHAHTLTPTRTNAESAERKESDAQP